MMDPWFLTGFTDAEGSFTLSIYRNNEIKIGWNVQLFFSITLHSKDLTILENIKSYFGVGCIDTKQGSHSVQFRVISVKDLKVVINHFDKFPLLTQKRADYELFKEAYYRMLNKEHLTMEGLRKIVAIKASMNRGLSEELKIAFSDVLPVPRLSVVGATAHEIKDPNWLVGFTSGEGCFMVRVYESSSIYQLIFKLTQHSRDEQLMRSLIQYWDCGNVYKYRKAIEFRIQKFSDIRDKIIPFFNKYPIQGIKALDYADFVKVADIMKVKGHLTAEGLDQIRKIKAGMNTGR